jgi:hypothetical protein
MALDPASLLARRGPVTIALLAGDADPKSFGKKEALAALTDYIAAANADERVAAVADETIRDKAARAFVLWQVYNDAYVGMLNRPASVTVTDKGSHGYTAAQIAGMKAIADDYQSQLETILASVATESSTPAPRDVFVHTYLTF